MQESPGKRPRHYAKSLTVQDDFSQYHNKKKFLNYSTRQFVKAQSRVNNLEPVEYGMPYVKIYSTPSVGSIQGFAESLQRYLECVKLKL